MYAMFEDVHNTTESTILREGAHLIFWRLQIQVI